MANGLAAPPADIAGDLYGRFIDDRYNTRIAGATLQLLPREGDGVLAEATTNPTGDFRFPANGRRRAGRYRVRTYIGGRPFTKSVLLFEDDVKYDLHRTRSGGFAGVAGLNGTYYRNHGLSAFGGSFYVAPRRSGFAGVLAGIGDAAASAKGFWSSLSLLQKAALIGGSGLLVGFVSAQFKGRR